MKRDPHIVGGENQGGGSAAGLNKFWRSWPDIHGMVAIAQNYVNSNPNPFHGRSTSQSISTEFLVVPNQKVGFRSSILSGAKEYLKRYHGGSHLVAEVNNGTVKSDPHIVGGENQGRENAAGLNKFWRNWPDIHGMRNIAQNYANSNPNPFQCVYQSNGFVTTINAAKGKSTSQSSTGWSGPSEIAVDGNTDGDGEGHVTHTTLLDKPWWEVDLAGYYVIDNIKVYNRRDCCSERLDNFDVIITNDGKKYGGISKQVTH